MRGSVPRFLVIALAVSAAACSSAPPAKSDAEYRRDVTTGMSQAIGGELKLMRAAVQAIADAAPLPRASGWDEQADAGAIASMKSSWTMARSMYEHLEGALEPLFPDLDASIDARYETALARGNDAYLFDDQGFVGLDAIERVLYAPTTPAAVVDFEKKLAGYVPAALPTNAQEALDFKTKLCARLVADIDALLRRWQATAIDIDMVYGGLTSLVAEQRGELDDAAAGAEESRYSQRAMANLRDNLEGVESIYGLFRDWLASKPEGSDVDARIEAAIADVRAAYDAVTGDDLPSAPADWNAASPSSQDLTTVFGRLFTAVSGAGDAQRDGGLLHEMQRARQLLALE